MGHPLTGPTSVAPSPPPQPEDNAAGLLNRSPASLPSSLVDSWALSHLPPVSVSTCIFITAKTPTNMEIKWNSMFHFILNVKGPLKTYMQFSLQRGSTWTTFGSLQPSLMFGRLDVKIGNKKKKRGLVRHTVLFRPLFAVVWWNFCLLPSRPHLSGGTADVITTLYICGVIQ